MDRVEKILDYLKETPDDSFLQHALALEYIKQGKDVEAKDLFESILKREPGYIGTYYHLAKLLERNGDNDAAAKTYEKGMQEAKSKKDDKAYNELRAAYEELIS